ncbi:MAG: hypothetical protein ACYCXK_02450 [Candidatus Humimicrobiaceae bacterium]
MALSTLMLILSSCEKDSQDTSLAASDNAANKSTTETTIDEDTSNTSQTSTTKNETSATQSTETGSETTSQATEPQAQQIIEVIAQTGGYLPRQIEAKAGVPTILVMKSEGAYGCERAFNIFDPVTKTVLASEILPENGQTEFDLGIQAKGTELFGVCSMGMYYFQILFN